jgi:excisionase family DNA binding protein
MQRTPGIGGRPRAASEFARRARERLARGEPLTIAIGGSEVVLPPELRQPVLAVLEEAAEPTPSAGTEPGGDERIGAGPGGGGLPPLPLGLPPELTVGQAADLLGIPRAALAQMIDRGELAAGRAGPRRRVATADVLARRDAVRTRRAATMADVIAASRELDLYPRDHRRPATG